MSQIKIRGDRRIASVEIRINYADGESSQTEKSGSDLSLAFAGHCPQVTVNGSISGHVQTEGDVTCGRVGGSVYGEDVTCGPVGADVKAAGDVMAGSVGGDVTAAGDVRCGKVGGNISAAGDVSCTKVGGGIRATGDITAEEKF